MNSTLMFPDTWIPFEPELRIDVRDALKELFKAESALEDADSNLSHLLRSIGYEV